MLAVLAERGMRHVPYEWALRWVQERVPPRGRQNLGQILRANGLDDYDEVALLVAAQGRSAQDDFLLRPVEERAYAAVKLPNPVGPQLARARMQAGLTQRELAERTGIDQATISRIEKRRTSPTLQVLEQLAGALGRHARVTIE